MTTGLRAACVRPLANLVDCSLTGGEVVRTLKRSDGSYYWSVHMEEVNNRLRNMEHDLFNSSNLLPILANCHWSCDIDSMGNCNNIQVSIVNMLRVQDIVRRDYLERTKVRKRARDDQAGDWTDDEGSTDGEC